MKISESYPSTSQYLRTADLHGRAVTVTIADVSLATMRDKEGRDITKPVVSFRHAKKGWILNQTCAAQLVAILGSDQTEDWIDSAIVLYPTQTPFGGRMVDCIRVKAAPRPSAATRRAPVQAPPVRPVPPPVAAAPVDTYDEIPF